MKLLLEALQAGNQSGTGTYVQNLLAHLPEEHDFEAATCLLRPEVQLLAPWTQETVPKTPRIVSLSRRFLRFGAFVDRHGPDIVHFPANFGTLTPIHSKTRPAIVTTLHDLTFLENPRWFPAHRALAYRVLAARTIAQSDLILADSNIEAEAIRSHFRLPEHRVRSIPLGVSRRFAPVPVNERNVVRERYAIPGAFFLFVGTLEPRKNLPRLIRAWDAIADNCGCDLVIAGREGWKTRDIHAALRNARHGKRIRTIGFLDDDQLPALMSAATAFVWPSLSEGFGFPPLEAMACGTPVLTSDVSSLPETMGDAALLVDPTNETALSQALLRILRDEKLRENLTRRGIERARAFEWAKTARQTIQAYEYALEHRK